MKGFITPKLVSAALVLIALVLAGLDYVARRYAQRRETEAVAQRLISAARLIADSPGANPAEELLSWSGNAGARIELIHGDGADASSAKPEVQEAVQGRLGTVVRGEFCYVAVPLRSAGERVALRLSAPVDIGAASRMRRQLATITLLSVPAALVIAFLAWRSLASRISRLKEFAEALLEVPAPGGGRASQDELGALERALSRVAAQLRDLFDRWRLESSRSEAILSSTAEGVLAVDRELLVVFCNHAVTRTMG